MPFRALTTVPTGTTLGVVTWPDSSGVLEFKCVLSAGQSATKGYIRLWDTNYKTTFETATLATADRTITVPDVTGTMAIAIPGAVIAYAGASAPLLWLLCYGQAISRTTYAALFAVISTTYGVGDGSTTFNLPDLRGRVVAGQDDMGGSSANRLTGSITGSVDGDVLGGTGGEEGHTLTANTDAGGTGEQGTASLNGSGTEIVDGSPGGSWASDQIQINAAAAAHNTVQPTIILNYIIYAGV